MRLQWKLFLIILCSSTFLVLSMFLTTQWTVDRGLLKYVNIREQQSNSDIAKKLAHAYENYGSWSFLENKPHLLDRLARSVNPSGDSMGERLPPREQHDFAFDRRPPPPGHRPPGDFRDRRPPPPPRDSLRARPEERSILRPPPKPRPSPFTVLDGLKNYVAGRPIDASMDDAQYVEIRHPQSDELVGWLAFKSPKHLSDDFDLALAEELTTGFVTVSLVTLLISAALAIPLSYLLVRRIKAIACATRKVAEGDYAQQLDDRSKDELGRLATNFNHLAKTLEANDSARKRWIADISHELRTPLAITSGELEAMIDGVRETTEQNLRSAHQEIKHLNRLIDDLYQLTNADIGALKYHKTELNLNALLEHAVYLFEDRALEVGIDLEAKIGSSSCQVWADSDRIKQLINNVLNNALKYTDAPGRIWVQLNQTKRSAVIVIEDSSPSVEANALDKLFDPLYRVETSRNRKTGGAGLGLAICKQIVMGHSGTIEAEHSHLGGIKITIKLPLV